MKKKQERGDCFNCDERWTPSRRCSNGGLRVLAATEDDRLIDVEEFTVDNEIDISGYIYYLGNERCIPYA